MDTATPRARQRRAGTDARAPRRAGRPWRHAVPLHCLDRQHHAVPHRPVFHHPWWPATVRNGPGKVSISMSIIFNTDATRRAAPRRMTQAMVLNDKLRRLRLSPVPAGRAAWRDGAKAALWQAGASLARRLR